VAIVLSLLTKGTCALSALFYLCPPPCISLRGVLEHQAIPLLCCATQFSGCVATSLLSATPPANSKCTDTTKVGG
jgi:hypothetical protein